MPTLTFGTLGNSFRNFRFKILRWAGLTAAAVIATAIDGADHTTRRVDVHVAIRIGVPVRIARARTVDVGRVGVAAIFFRISLF